MAKVKAEEQSSFSDFTGAMTALAEEKGIGVDGVMETVETAIAAAYKKEYGKRGQSIRAELNSVSGDMKFFLVKEVVDDSVREFIDPDAEVVDADDAEVQDIIVDEEAEEKKPRFNPERDIMIDEAKEKYGEVALGESVEEELPSYTDFGRVAAQTAKQVIIQRIREAERNAMYTEYKEKEGEIVNGTVQRIEGKNVFVDLGKSVGVLFPREQVRGERYNIGQRVKVFVESVELDPKGPGIKLSRVHPELIRRLFELEVPEIFAGSVEIKAIAREAGSRSKIAVYTEEEGIDPIGSCVGQKGTRVNAIIDELGGEKVDIIEWSNEPEEFISAAMSPATVLAVNLDQDKSRATVIVPDDQLSLAIGKRGQNVRLAVKLTGWDLDVISSEESRVAGMGDAVVTDDQKEESESDTSEDVATEEVVADTDASVSEVVQEAVTVDESDDVDVVLDDVQDKTPKKASKKKEDKKVDAEEISEDVADKK